jgi:hypothetical protein
VALHGLTNKLCQLFRDWRVVRIVTAPFAKKLFADSTRGLTALTCSGGIAATIFPIAQSADQSLSGQRRAPW